MAIPSGNKSGFTIVELLIVIVVIAVLAAISIVAYNGIQNRAYNSAVQSDLRNLAVLTRNAATLNDGTPPAATQAGLESFAKASKSAYQPRSGTSLLYCRTDTKFAFVAQSRTGQAYVVEDGNIRSIGTWGGGNDDNACGGNAAVGLVDGREPGYGYINLYRNSTWQTWVKG